MKEQGKHQATKILKISLGAKQVQPPSIMVHVLTCPNHARPVVHDSEDTRDMAEITRKRMMEKMKSPLCVENKVRIAPPDYSKENLLATFAPQRNLTPEQIFWSIDENDRKKAETSVPNHLSHDNIKNLEHQIQEKDNVIRDLKVLVSNVNDRSCEPYNANDVTDLLEQNERFRAKIEKGVGEAALQGIESVETVREIVEEARVVKPLDTALNSACKYTKLSQELVEYVIGTCPKEFTERDNKAAAFIPLTRKKQVTFTDTCSTSTNNTQKHGVHQKAQQSNVQVIPSTGVSSSTRASGSKPRSNTKHNRILPAKSVNNKKVEDHPRTNKSVWTKVNRV
ncbi:hypothetical protein Tco_0255126 [Tanacetum coccineum]